MKVYFAGPLFTPYERDYISSCARVLREHGFEPFVPHEDKEPARPDDARSAAKRCFDNDFGALEPANAMLAILNGTEVDDGTACEIGIFYALAQSDPAKKGIVALHDDWRTNDEAGEGKGLNAFVLGCIRQGGTIVKTLDDAIEQLSVWRAELAADNSQTEESR